MKTLIKNYIYNTSFQLLLLFVPIITTPYLARIIGSSGIGHYSYYYSISSYFMMFILLGLENYGNREIARARDNKEQLSHTFCSIYALQLFMGLLVSIVYLLFILFIFEDKFFAALFYINVFATCFDLTWCMYGLELFKAIAVRSFIVKISTTLLIFTFVKSSDDLIAYCFIMLLGNLFSQLLCLPIIKGKINFIKPNIKDVMKHIKPNMWLFLTVLSVGIFKTADKLMLGLFEPTKIQLGYYEFAERIISIPNMMVVSLGTVMLPRTANMLAKEEEDNTRLIHLSIAISAILSGSIAFGIMGVSKEFIPLFYGKGYEECVSLYLILLPASIFMSFASVIRTQYLLPHNKDVILLKSGLISNVVNIGINLLLIPRFGAIGAAVGTLVAEMTICFYQTWNSKNKLPIVKYLKSFVPIVGIGLFMFLVIFNIHFNYSNVLCLILKICLGAILYCLCLFIYLKVSHDNVVMSIVREKYDEFRKEKI